PELLGLRYGRMASSPLAFLRGALAVMAADLAATSATGLHTQLCGDAHLANVATSTTPGRGLVLDIGDLDETVRGPFEWDLKRLAASLVLAAREASADTEVADAAVATCVQAYRRSLRAHAKADVLDVWEASLDEHEVVHVLGERVDTDRHRAAHKLTEVVDGEVRIREDPPALSREALPPMRRAYAQRFLGGYLASLPTHRRSLLERYEVVDAARRVVGIGSVGTRCFVVLLHGRDEDDPLVLQVQQAGPSVWEPHLATRPPRPHGRRIVEGQRTLQAAGDPFLGWTSAVGPDGVSRDYHVRQVRTADAAVDVTSLGASALVAYAGLWGRLLADAHARGGQAAELAGYLGKGGVFLEAMIRFAHAFADVTERDHQRLVAAVRAGRVPRADLPG
ncbi:MAG: DUF2252 domain-containing protein, partial [Nitriliruptoraceae bacterium]